TVRNLDHPPVVSSASTAEVAEGSLLTLEVTATDPDADAIASFTADVSGLPASNGAQFTTNGSKTSGTFTWTPSYASADASPYTVTFTASNTLSGTAATAITVTNVDRAPVLTAPAALGAPEGQATSFT